MITCKLTSVASTVLVLGALLSKCQPAHAIPAFARKYSLPCSACHEAWPKLNDFGIAFRDRGYQLGNERDSPIWQNPSYWPITMRITPQWHRENSSNQLVDIVPGNPALGKRFRTSRPTALILAEWTFGLPELYTKTFPFRCCRRPILPDPSILKTCSFVLTIYFGRAG